MSLKNPVTPPGIDPGTVRLVAQRYIYFFYWSVQSVRHVRGSVVFLWTFCAHVRSRLPGVTPEKTIIHIDTAVGTSPLLDSNFIHQVELSSSHLKYLGTFVCFACRNTESVLYCTVLYCTVLYCTVLYCTVLLPPAVNPFAVNYLHIYIYIYIYICRVTAVSG